MSDSTSLPTIPPDISNLTIPMLVGIVLNWFLFGILTVQVYIYHSSFPKDSKRIKILVYGIYLVETAQACMVMSDLCFWFAQGFGDLNKLTATYISPVDTPLLGSISSLAVQLFYCHRIWVVQRSLLPLSIGIGVISVAQTAGGIWGAAFALQRGNLADVTGARGPQYLWLAGASLADMMIAVTMTFLFYRARNAVHSATKDVFGRIVRLTVETNAITASVAIVSLAMFVSEQHYFYFITPTLVIGKLYSNALLVTFNNRVSLRQHMDQRDYISADILSTVNLPHNAPDSSNAHMAQRLSMAVRRGSSFEDDRLGMKALPLKPEAAGSAYTPDEISAHDV